MNGETWTTCQCCSMLFPHSQSSLLQKRDLHIKHSLFKCDFCPRKFPKQNLVIPHSNISHSEEVTKLWISCSICKEYFPDEEQVTRHKTLKHNDAVFHCDVCNSFLATKNTFIEHVRRKHPDIVEKSWLQCNICSKKFPNENGLRSHEISVHKPQPCKPKSKPKSSNKTDLQHHQANPALDQCSFCTATFTEYDNFLEHNRAHHAEMVEKQWFPCDSCKTFHPNKASLRRHIASEHRKVGKIVCTFCPKTKTFTKNHNFLEHNRANHAEIVAKQWLPCETCNRLYPSETFLRRHIAIIHRKEVKLCNFCPKHFGSEQNYNLHVKRKHSEQSGKKFIKCSICQNKFWSKKGLDRHTLAIHPTASSAEDEFRSTEMTNKQNKSTLENKETTKTTKLNLNPRRVISKCEFCPKAFEGIVRLREHNQQCHLKIIQDFWFRCDFCQELRPSQNSLFRHFQTSHNNNSNSNSNNNNNDNNGNIDIKNNNGCNFCSKSLTSKQYNFEHMRESHPESFYSKWLECSVCKKIFRTKDGLSRHTTKVHTCTKVQNKMVTNENCEKVESFEKDQILDNDELTTISTNTSLQASEKSIDNSAFNENFNDAFDSSLSKKRKIRG